MRIRRFLPPEMAAAIRDGMGEARPQRFRFHALGTGAVTAAIEGVGANDAFVSIDGDAETRQQIEASTAQACRGMMSPVGEGTAIPFQAESSEGHNLSARLYEFAGAEPRAMVEFESLDGSGATVPDWAAHLPDAGGTAAYAPSMARSTLSATPDALAALKALFTPGRQQELHMVALAVLSDVELPDAWEVIEAESRHLGMALSRDKADVRTALAPLATTGDARDLMARVTPMQAAILQRDARFVLVDRASGTPLGALQGRGGVYVGKDAPFPCLLSWEAALSLAERGVHGTGKARAELSPGLAARETMILMSGLNPARMTRQT